MLGDQSWGLPDTYDTFNTSARLDHTFSPSWLAFAAASFSHSLIQDNVLYAYGCYYESECNTGSAPYPFFFAPDGTYDIYDYRDPGELRIDAEAEAMLTGHINTGAVTQDLAAGGELFLRSVQQPGFYTVQNPYDPSGVVQDGAVYTYVGSENIYQPIAALPRPARQTRSSQRFNPPVRAAFGKTATRPPPSCRIAFIFPAAFSSSPAPVTIRCAITTTPHMQAVPISLLHPRRHTRIPARLS